MCEEEGNNKFREKNSSHDHVQFINVTISSCFFFLRNQHEDVFYNLYILILW